MGFKNHKNAMGQAEAAEAGTEQAWRRQPSLSKGGTLKDCWQKVSKQGADLLDVPAWCGTEGMSKMHSSQGHRHQKEKSHSQGQGPEV